jgi:signal transduction histidine kinase
MAQGVILIVVDHKSNRDLLEKTLKKYYTVQITNAEDSLKQEFDLGIFDGAALNRLRKQIKAHREKKSDLFQPILLVSSRQDIGIVTGQLWQSIDEIIFSPIEKKELLARVEVLLRTHNYSVELARLYQNAREQATYDERQRLARELHDSVTQMIYSSSILAQALPRLQETDPERARTQLEEVIRLNVAALSEMRMLLLELRPGNIIRTNFKDLLDQLVVSMQGRRNINISCNVQGITVLPEEIHLGLYRIVQEALNNVIKHSKASEAQVELTTHDDQLILRIKDNGGGFDTAQRYPGIGLDGMGERAASMGASISVSSRKSEGTEIVVRMPMPKVQSNNP